MTESLFDIEKIEKQIERNENTENKFGIGVFESENCYSYCLAKNHLGKTIILISKVAHSKTQIDLLKIEVKMLKRIFNAEIFEETI